MEQGNSYGYFALKGDDFNPQYISGKLGIVPSASWKKGDKTKYNPNIGFSCWEISTEQGKEYFDIDKLVDEIVTRLFAKIETINELKAELNLNSVLEIVMDIDVNPEQSTPSLGHDLKTIEFLYRTNTVTDVDIYTFNSAGDTTK